MKRVLKYGTGHEIPAGATYLSTITEDVWEEECMGHCNHEPACMTHEKRRYLKSRFVWHYFLVECDRHGQARSPKS